MDVEQNKFNDMVIRISRMREDLETMEELFRQPLNGESMDEQEVIDINREINTLYRKISDMKLSCKGVRICRKCGKPFIMSSLRLGYCDRIGEDGERCSDNGSRQKYKEKLSTDEMLKVYNRAYKTHHARIRSKLMTREQFNEWAAKARKMLDNVRAGKISEYYFQNWLKI